MTWRILPPWSPSTGPLEAVPVLRPHARGNAGARPEDVPLLKREELLRCAIYVYDRMRAVPPMPSKIRMYHTLVVAPEFLAISSIGPSATVLR
jgi:hypothetical protein